MCSHLLLRQPCCTREARASAPAAQINCAAAQAKDQMLTVSSCESTASWPTPLIFFPTTVSIEYITVQKHPVFIHAAITPQHHCYTHDFQLSSPCSCVFKQACLRDPGRIFLRFLACHSPHPEPALIECFIPNFQSKLLVARSQGAPIDSVVNSQPSALKSSRRHWQVTSSTSMTLSQASRTLESRDSVPTPEVPPSPSSFLVIVTFPDSGHDFTAGPSVFLAVYCCSCAIS